MLESEMTAMTVESFGDVTLTRHDAVAEVVFSRPPNNFFDLTLIRDIATALETIDRSPDLRAVVLASEGKAFCAGASFSGGEGGSADPGVLYREALRIFATRKPIVAAVQGAAIGGGMGLAMAADFRVVSPGLTHTLPRAIGVQAAALLFYTGRRIGGEEALRLGVADVLAPAETLRERALGLAAEIAENAPLAVEATRATLREGLVEAISAQTAHEGRAQMALFATQDFKEGVRAVAERRPGQWVAA
jgi:enoyl-CoA hydratase/carnithine racemase